eukprot:72166-Rhodomonas_salina.1
MTVGFRGENSANPACVVRQGELDVARLRASSLPRPLPPSPPRAPLPPAPPPSTHPPQVWLSGLRACVNAGTEVVRALDDRESRRKRGKRREKGEGGEEGEGR